MTRRRKLLILLAAVPVLFVTVALLYLNFADLSSWRDTVARLASDAIGRELRINGEFQPEVGFTTRVVATDVTLANADWSDDPWMVSVDRLAGEIDLLSILFGPITIGDVEISGARVLFETNDDGRFNWALGSGEPSEASSDDGSPVELVIGHALVNDLQLVYTAQQSDPLDATLTHIEFSDDGTGMLDLDLAGSIGKSPVEISGRLGTFIGLINVGAVENDLSGHLGSIEFESRGRIAELATLGGADLTVAVHGPDLIAASEIFGLSTIESGPFQVDLGVRPAADGSNLELAASVGAMTAEIGGTIDSLTDPGVVDLTVNASGPNVAVVGAFANVEGIPSEAFHVSGHVRWEGFPISCDNVEVRVGDNTLSANGVLGEPPLMLGTDFTFDGNGPDIASIAALAGLDLPRDDFAVDGRLVRKDGGINVEGVEARVGQTTLKVNGIVGDPPEYAGTTLSFEGSGANLAHFRDLANVALPAESFEITGKLVQGDGAIDLEAVRARLGSHRFQVTGQLSTEARFSGTDLQLNAKGPDASQLAAIAELSDVPAEPYSIDGRVRVLEKGYRVTGMAGSLGSLAVKVDGFVAPPPTLVGSDLQIHVEDPDISHPAAIAGIEGLPHDAFSIDTRLRIEDRGYRIDDFEATVGDMAFGAKGLISALPEFEGTRMHLTARGPKLSSLNPYIDQTGLPAAPFSVSGNARVNDGAYALDNVVAEVDGNSVTLDGTIHPTADFVGTDVEIRVSAPDLGRAGGLAAGFVALPALPAEPSTLNTRLRIEESGYEIKNLRATLANAEASIDGLVGPPPGFVGTDLTIDSDGPNASLFTAFTGVTVPVAPFKISGRIQRTEDLFLFDRVAVQLGGHSVSLHGSLGEAPRLVGTDLELHASGDSTALIAELAGFRKLPDHPFRVSGRFKGTPERFATDGFEIMLGESDLKGSLEVDIRAKPTVTATVTSNHLDLSHYLKQLEQVIDDEPEEGATPGTTSGSTAISDKPIDFSPLRRADAEIDITVGTIQFPLMVLSEVELVAKLNDGRLEIERLAAIGQDQGQVSGSMVLEPKDDRYFLRTDLEARQLRLDIAGSTVARMDQPPIDIDINLEAVGATPHELASTANGAIQLVIGKGTMDSKVLDLVTADILLTLLNSFNPFAKQDAATEMQCGVALLSIADGLATLEPMAFQSDKMTMLGDGRIDLGTEKLNLEWITKPRKGIGISASMITNPYIKLGGTLAEPSVELKPIEAMASTGVAVATMGLSLVAKGMFDRVTAEKKVCKIALEEIGRRADGSPKQPGKKK